MKIKRDKKTLIICVLSAITVCCVGITGVILYERANTKYINFDSVYKKNNNVTKQEIQRTKKKRVNVARPKQQSKSNIYKWKDKDGKIHITNTYQPINNSTLEVSREKNYFSKQTKFYYNNGTPVVNAVIENNGRKVNVKLILDTGCSITQIHPNVFLETKTKSYRLWKIKYS